jgi:hypothetical protein
MSEYCKNCKEMQDEIDRLRRVIKDAREMVWDLNCTGYVVLDDLEWLDDEVANNERKPDLTNFDTSSVGMCRHM